MTDKTSVENEVWNSPGGDDVDTADDFNIISEDEREPATKKRSPEVQQPTGETADQNVLYTLNNELCTLHIMNYTSQGYTVHTMHHMSHTSTMH